MNIFSSFVLAAGLCVFQARAQSHQITPESPRPPRLALELRESRLSLDAEQVTLGQLAQILATRTGINFSFHDPLIEGLPVTVRFHDQPLQEGIHDLLQGHSYVISKALASGGLAVTVLASPSIDHTPETATRIKLKPQAIAPGDALALPNVTRAVDTEEISLTVSADAGFGWTFDTP